MADVYGVSRRNYYTIKKRSAELTRGRYTIEDDSRLMLLVDDRRCWQTCVS